MKFIRVIDCGLREDKETGDPIGLDATDPHHGEPVYINTDHVLFFTDIKLPDGNIVCEISYSNGHERGAYTVLTRAAEIAEQLGFTAPQPRTIGTPDYLNFYTNTGTKPNEVSSL